MLVEFQRIAGRIYKGYVYDYESLALTIAEAESAEVLSTNKAKFFFNNGESKVYVADGVIDTENIFEGIVKSESFLREYAHNLIINGDLVLEYKRVPRQRNKKSRLEKDGFEIKEVFFKKDGRVSVTLKNDVLEVLFYASEFNGGFDIKANVLDPEKRDFNQRIVESYGVVLGYSDYFFKPEVFFERGVYGFKSIKFDANQKPYYTEPMRADAILKASEEMVRLVEKMLNAIIKKSGEQ